LTDNLAWLFDAIRTVLGTMVERLEDLLTWPDPLVAILIFAVLGLVVRSWTLGLFSLLGFGLIEAMGLWPAAMSSLALVLVAAAVALLVGIPMGILAARSRAVGAAMRPVLDFMQTMPAMVYLIPGVVFFGIGRVPGIVATIVFSMPPAVRLTQLGINQVDREVVEAAEAFGAHPRSILARVQLPLALPTIMAGINQVIMLALSMVVLAGMVGAGGLGAVVFRGITRLDVGVGFEGGLAVVILAIFLDRVTAALGDRSRHRTSERAAA
jgi:glycine betaine/proline transport system permease protein